MIPILNFVAVKKNFNKIVWFIVRFVWFAAVCVFLVYFYTAIMNFPIEYTFNVFGKVFDFSNVAGIETIFYCVFALFCVVFFLVYSKFLQLSHAYVNRVLSRIIKK